MDWRRDPRYSIEVDAELNGAQCSIEDISVGGARVAIQRALAPEVGDSVRIAFTLAGCGHSLSGVVRRVSEDGLTSQIGIAFAGEQHEAIELLASSLDDFGAAQAS